MTLVDNDIANLVATQHLIDPFSTAHLENCRYNLRAARAFLPKTGEEIVVGAGKSRNRDHWVIKPSETLVMLTKETIHLPLNIYATYSQLNGLARLGLMLINVSIIEPGYEGRLSCYLVNFSKENAILYPDDDVAKICFHELTGTPQRPAPLTISDSDYQKALVRSAQRYPVSFMDIGNVEKRIVGRATKSVNRSVTIAVGFLAVLALWSSIEPLVSKYMWEKQGVMTNTQRLEVMKLQGELEKMKNELSTASNDLKTEKKISELEERLKVQTEEIIKLKDSLTHH